VGTLRAILIGTFAAGLAACGGGAQATVKVKTKPVVKKDKPKPVEAPVEEPKQITENISVSMDLAEACDLKVDEKTHVNPKFNYDRQELLPEDRRVLEMIATCLNTGTLKGRSINLVGRADPRGTDEYNLALGSRRAYSVSGYLEKIGVGKGQMFEKTRGSLDATGTTENGWQNDRRVDIVLMAPNNSDSAL
jgi:peptidoglycan-associated lipoprotein